MIKGVLAAIPLAVLAVFGLWFYRTQTVKDRTIEEQQRVIAKLEKNLDQAWATELVADVRVTAIRPGEMDLVFVQYEPGTEKPSFHRTMTLKGEEFYIDALVVKFDRKFIEAGDGLRGKSLLMFRRAFGDQQKPVDGVPLFKSKEGTPAIPERMQVDPQPSDFERTLWTEFWQLANDPDKAKARGITVAQGEAPHIKPVLGQVYKVTLRQSGGVDLAPRIPAAALDK